MRSLSTPLLVVALAVLMAPRPLVFAAGGGSGAGGNLDCLPAPPSVVAQFADPTEIVGTAGGISCPTPGALAPGKFGSGHVSGTPPAPVVGAHCHFDFETPVQFRLVGSTPQLMVLEPTAGNPYDSDPQAPTWQAAQEGWISVADWNAPGPPGPQGADLLYQMAGTTDFSLRWTFDGTWTQVGSQVKCQPDPTSLGGGWATPCTVASNAQPDCFDPSTPAVPPVSAGLPITGLGIDLQALLRGRFTGGTVASLPAAPNPGVTNVPVCFSVSGMTVDGQPADPRQDIRWERIVEGPDVGEGRHVYFVFVIDVSHQSTTWDFGDGTVVTIPNGGVSPEPVPRQCPAVSAQQFLVAHTYHSYSTGDGFHVTVSHQFGIDVTEYWRDADPHAHRLDFPDAVPPVVVPAAPQPAYVIPVVQEEGVPIG